MATRKEQMPFDNKDDFFKKKQNPMNPQNPMTQQPVMEKPVVEQAEDPMANPMDNPMGPSAVPTETGIPDHTHPEYDQLLVKIQELENRIADMEMEDQAEDQGQMQANPQMQKLDKKDEKEEEKDMVEEDKKEKEDLKGTPEIEKSEKDKSLGSVTGKSIPSTNEPPAGKPITPETAEKDAVSKVDDPKGLNKPTVQKNAVSSELVGRKTLVGMYASGRVQEADSGIKVAKEYLQKMSVRY